MLKVWNVSLIVATFSLALLGTFLVRSGILESIHAFGASTVGTPLLGLIAVVIVGSAALIVCAPRRPALRAADRVAGLARGRLPGQQPAARRARGGDLLGHLLPADLGGAHRREVVARLALVRPLHGAAGDRPGPVHRDRAAAGLAQGERRGALAPGSRAAGGRRGRDRRGRRVHRRARPPAALVLFAFAFFALAALADRVLARRRRPSGRSAAAAAERRCAPSSPATAAATAATSSTPGSRSCSSPSPPRRASRPPRTCGCMPGDSGRGRRLHGHLRAPDPVDRPGGAEAQLRRGARRRPRRRAVRDAVPGAQLLLVDQRRRRRSPASSRARRPARSAARRASAATSGPRCAPTWRRSTTVIAAVDKQYVAATSTYC